MDVRALPGAASTSLLDLLTGPARRAEILAVFPAAVYLEVEATEAPARSTDRVVAAIATADALRLPCSVVVVAPFNPAASARGTRTAAIGDGFVQLPGATIVVRRWWRPRRPGSVDATSELGRAVRLLSALLPPLAHEVEGQASGLETSLACKDGGDARAIDHARQLIGRGPGLTPAGDDVLAALLLTLWAGPAFARTRAADLAAAVLADATARTTTLSATLLRHAGRGEGLPQVVDLVDSVASSDAVCDTITAKVSSLLDVGSSSGIALAHGVRIGLGTIAARRDVSSRGEEAVQ